MKTLAKAVLIVVAVALGVYLLAGPVLGLLLSNSGWQF